MRLLVIFEHLEEWREHELERTRREAERSQQ